LLYVKKLKAIGGFIEIFATMSHTTYGIALKFLSLPLCIINYPLIPINQFFERNFELEFKRKSILLNGFGMLYNLSIDDF
jgi:hypothetical protein